MSKFVVTATWDDVPHLNEAVKQELLKEIPAYQRDARTRGVPQLGAGAIYPFPETDLAVNDFDIPAHWPRAYGMDVGWNKTAAVWGARDNQAGVIYLYSEHYRGHVEPIIHAQAIRSRGEWIPGVIDPAADGRSQIDGRRYLEDLRKEGLDIEKAINAVESGIYEVGQLMSTGRLKVFKSLSNWWMEFRTFQRDTHGKIVDENKYHLMACTRYFIMSGRERMKAKPAPAKPQPKYVTAGGYSGGGWMGQ
jgi:Terminase RNaseH-like domain